MVKMRLTRMGDKKSPFYRIIVADARSPRDGKFIEQIGTYNPLTEPATTKIDVELAKKWLANGVQPTDSVKSMLVAQGIITQKEKAPAKTNAVKKSKKS